MRYLTTLYFTAPHPLQLSVERVSQTSFNLTASFLYTGGGDITQLIVYYRRINSQEEWTYLVTVQVEPTENYLQWRARVSNSAFSRPGVEFQVEAVNTGGYISPPVVEPEPIGKQLRIAICHK